MLTRRNLLKTGTAAIAHLLFVSMGPGRAGAQEAEASEAQAKATAEEFLNTLARYPVDRLKSLKLSYDVLFRVEWNVRMKIQATIWAERNDDGFVSSFNLTEPEGTNTWSWLMLSVFGRHTTEYKELMEGIETRIQEHFFGGSGPFRTLVMEELMPERTYYANQTAIRLQFFYEDRTIRFWPDKNQAPSPETLPYAEQIGPLTAFFNYLFFDKPVTEMVLVNVLKQVEDDASAPAGSGIKQVRYLFESQTMKFGPNISGKLKDYGMMVTLGGGNFLDIVYGDHLYYQMATDGSGNLKVPYAAHAEGIISKNKKRLKIQQLKRKFPNKESFEQELLREVDDILATRDIQVVLTDFDIALNS